MTFGAKPRRHGLAISLRAVRFDLVVWLRYAVSRHPCGLVLDAVVLPFCWTMLACVSSVAALLWRLWFELVIGADCWTVVSQRLHFWVQRPGIFSLAFGPG